ncbi:CapA family protein, partial [Romboutsia sp. 13368]|uniref:CapA family protein n=1 Tax=Romboutsia sp. 13368 TaxID=2708053 RepID=UPI0025E0204D
MGRCSRNKKRKIKNKFKLIIIFSLSLIILFISFKSFHSNNKVVKYEQVSKPSSTDKVHTVNLNAIGDVMAHAPQLNAQHDPKTNTYSFDNNYNYVSKYIQKADLAIANLETTLAGGTIPY